MTSNSVQPAYALGHSTPELARLTTQAELHAPSTRQLLLDAGLRPGMRVLDVGSGSGDVAFLAAELVGLGGEVVGTDRAAAAIAHARARALAQRLEHVSFIEGDPVLLDFERSFDAVVGRFVLMYYPDPAAALRGLARRLRPGGLIAFQEYDLHSVRTLPPRSTLDRAMAWMIAAFRAVGADTEMGLKLRQSFIAAGLPAPILRADVGVASGPEHPAPDIVAAVLGSLLPVIEARGIATAAEVDVATLADRLRAELLEGCGTMLMPPLVGAWARV